MLLFQLSLPIYSETIWMSIFGLKQFLWVCATRIHFQPTSLQILIISYPVQHILRNQVQFQTTVIKMNHQLCNCLQGFLFFINLLNSINWIMKKEAWWEHLQQGVKQHQNKALKETLKRDSKSFFKLLTNAFST